jgi:predicted oxidoreductase
VARVIDDAILKFCEAQRGLYDALLASGKSPEEAKATVMRSVVIGGNYLLVEQKWLRERMGRRS